jgi:hypothetical protein
LGGPVILERDVAIPLLAQYVDEGYKISRDGRLSMEVGTGNDEKIVSSLALFNANPIHIVYYLSTRR